jgi:hypothetical protein
MKKKFAIVVSIVGLAAASLPVASAGAQLTDTSTTLLLACDSGVSAQVTATLTGSTALQTGGPFAVACDGTSRSGDKRGSTRVLSSYSAGAVTVTSFVVHTAGGDITCSGGGPLGYKLACPSGKGPGATLTVR